jgi:hypothetical protein
MSNHMSNHTKIKIFIFLINFKIFNSPEVPANQAPAPQRWKGRPEIKASKN